MSVILESLILPFSRRIKFPNPIADIVCFASVFHYYFPCMCSKYRKLLALEIFCSINLSAIFRQHITYKRFVDGLVGN